MPRYVLVVTREEAASANIGASLLRTGKFEKVEENVYTCGDDLLYWHDAPLVEAGDMDKRFDAACFIYCYRHRSEKGVASYSVHFVGNPVTEVWGSGEPRSLGVAHPGLAARMLQCLEKVASDDVKVTYEVTHHGPTSVKTPLFFVELGSSPKQWEDPAHGAKIAAAVVKALEAGPANAPVALGFGGGHYPDRFTRRALAGKYILGHMFSKYVIEKGLDPAVVAQALEKSAQPVAVALFDKSCGKAAQRTPLIEFLKQQGIEVKKLT